MNKAAKIIITLFYIMLGWIVWRYPSKGVQDAVLWILVVYAIARHRSEWQRWYSPVGKLALVIAILTIMVMPFGHDPVLSLRRMVRHADSIALALVLPMLMSSQAKSIRLIFYSAAGVSLVIIYDLVRLITTLGSDVLREAHSYEPFIWDHSNISAMAAVMTGIVWLFLLMKHRSTPVKALGLGVMLLLSLAYLVVIRSRGPQLALIGALGISIIAMAPGWKKKTIVIVLAILFCTALWSNRGLINPRFEEGEGLSKALLVQRDIAWNHSTKLISEKPLTGYGYHDQVFRDVYHGSNPPDADHSFWHPHQYWMNVAFCYGVPVAVLHFLLFAGLTIGLLLAIKREQAFDDRVLPGMLIALMAAIHIFGLADTPTNIVNLALLWLVPSSVAVIAMSSSNGNDAKDSPVSRNDYSRTIDTDGDISISVIVPLYNQAGTIERTLQSIQNQSVPPQQVIVVDDGSTDDGAQKVEAFSNDRIVLVRQKNAGVSVARNRGVAKATTDLVAFLDADDEWQPSFLKDVLALRERCPDAIAWATAFKIIEDGKADLVGPVGTGLPLNPDGGIIADFFLSSLRMSAVQTSGIMCRKDIFDKVQGFPEGVNLGEDLDLWIRLALEGPIAFVPTIGVIYHKEGTGHATDRCLHESDQTAIRHTIEKALSDDSIDASAKISLRALLVDHLITVTAHAIKRGDRRTAENALRDAWSHKVRRVRWLERFFRYWRKIRALPTA